MIKAFLIFFIILSISFCVAYVQTMIKLDKVSKAFIEVYLSNNALQTFILNNKQSIGLSDEEIHRENFIKFLSDSREWAFDYIENSQSVVKEVIDYLENKNNDFDKQYAKKLKQLISEGN